ncbi:hypothetical protein MYSTI_08006 [Myxococcus stipitatus DSM 14675]|uniref:Uncharacterized protein n=1 Tax=Myxococcus stipitatus (strain DSM 14675 / JCM 12634 / Mx s8) TaxID=1278073 RepID=L7UNX9_MYXSD|nr:hypothetical protein [Myxococcus stipitatus]AGC49272.1 hypothetical protein MYSTI_08006 [Myxococcus stipitatus DSM 14675]
MSRWHAGVRVLGALVVLAAAREARAGSELEVFRFRTQEDAAKPPDAAVCAGAPFETTVKLGASLYVTQAGERERSVGTATACIRLTAANRLVPGEQLPMYVRFKLPEGDFTASGACQVVSNDVPEAGLVLAGCALKLVEVPAGYLGGMVSSTSVFNPKKLPGYATGSYYTLTVYRGPPKPKAAEAKSSGP